MSKANFLSCAAVVLFVFLINGCVSIPSSPTPRFYMPGSITKEQSVEKFEIASGVIVAVGPIRIPAYQDRPQIVTRNKDGTLLFAQFERWGEPLDSGIARLINDDLASLLPAASFQVFPCNFAIPLDYQVIVEVLQLDSELEKDMVFTGQWSIIDAKSRELLLTKRTRISKPINPHNYFGLAQALGDVCFSLSREIAENLSMLSKQPKSSKP
ncbi:MAG: PqiC family protein [Candidatus Omnitrophota bacterium]|nr:PqiC family protein [Candidatus Omnitrophota bacterium]